jgi:hypothetical protein
MRSGLGVIPVFAALCGCRATTPRPPFVPYPEAAHGEIGFGIPDPLITIARATRTLADALAADSMPVAAVHEQAGYLETPWFDVASLKPTGRRPLGPDVVRVRAWVNPAKPGFSAIEVEAVYRPVADPSRPERELEAPVPDGHPVGQRIARTVKRLVDAHGEPAEVRPAASPAPVAADTAGRAAPPEPRPAPPPRPDTTARRDTTRSR